MLGGRVMGAAPAPGDDGLAKGFGGDPYMPSKTVFMAGVPGSAGPDSDSLSVTQHRKIQNSFRPCLPPDASYLCRLRLESARSRQGLH